MFSTVQAPAARVQVERARDSAWLDELLAGLGWLLWWVLRLLVFRFPLLGLATAGAAAAAWGTTVYGSAAWIIPAALLLAAGLTLRLTRPGLLSWLRELATGQALGAIIYRPRWEDACWTAGLTVRAGPRVHLPGLVRVRRRRGVDSLTVRMAPGNTAAEWAGACGQLAATMGAHHASVRPGSRPGWVVVDVLRRDPLAGERVTTDPARHRCGPVEVGRDEYGERVLVDPYGVDHAAIQGATRSGKSSLCYGLLGALAWRSDVIVTGVDPTGLLLAPFAGSRGGQWIATGTRADDLAHAVEVVCGLVTLMDERIAHLSSTGRDKIATFGPGQPAVWVVLEEYPGLISALRALDAERGSKPGDRLAPRLERKVGRLVKEGRKAGITVLILAQRMSASAVDTDDRANLGLRISLRVDNGDAIRMLHDGLASSAVEAVRQFVPGVGLIEAPGSTARRVRFHYTSYETYRSRVSAGIAATACPARVDSHGVLSGQLVTPAHPAPEPQGWAA